MILQELIRNFILYREVVRPMLASWKDSLGTGYYREIAAISSSEVSLNPNEAKIMGGGEELGWDMSDEYEARSVTHISGTLTITNHIRLSMNEYDLFYEVNKSFEQASVSKDIYIMLTDELMRENIEDIGKTHSQTSISNTDSFILSVPTTMSATTGYANQQINSFLFETHEKREYLGEFSLTHEEIPLLYQLGGGEYHDIY